MMSMITGDVESVIMVALVTYIVSVITGDMVMVIMMIKFLTFKYALK